jgi:hypothetical protein
VRRGYAERRVRCADAGDIRDEHAANGGYSECGDGCPGRGDEYAG